MTCRHRAAMIEQFVIACRGQRGQAEQAQVVPGAAREFRFGDGLRGLAADSRDLHQPLSGTALELRGDLRGQAKHGLEEADPRISDGELGGVHAHRDASRAGIAIVAREGHLTPLVELAPGVQSQRVRGNRHSAM